MRILDIYFWCQKLEYNHSLHVTKCIQLGGQGGRYLGNILTIKDMLQYSESFRLLISLYLSYKYIFYTFTSYYNIYHLDCDIAVCLVWILPYLYCEKIR